MSDEVNVQAEMEPGRVDDENGIVNLDELFRKFDQVLDDVIRIPGQPAWIVLCGYAIGETSLFCCLANEFAKTHGHGIILVVTPKHVPVARMYAHRFLKIVVMPDVFMRTMLRSGYIPQDRFELDQPFSACWIDLGFRFSDGIRYLGRFPGRGGVSDTDLYRFFLRLPWNARIEPPRIAPECEDDAWQLAKQVGLRAGKSVVLCPINNSDKKLPDIFWKATAARLNETGYKVFTNMGGLNSINGPPTMPVEGTVPVDLPINLVIPFINFAGRGISGGNGMFFLIMLAGFESFKMTQLLQLPRNDEEDYSSLGYNAPTLARGVYLSSSMHYLAPELCLRTPLNEFLVPYGASPDELNHLAVVVADQNTDDPSCFTRYEANGNLFVKEHLDWLRILV